MIRRIAIDHARQGRRQARKTARLAAETETAWFEPPGENGDRAELLERSLRDLPAEQREVVVLKIWGGLTFEAIGEVLGISPHTAASRYRYALNHLRRTLSPVLT
jgi:RNA polymerase sigma-70 factor (ECF subfamily)